MLKHLAIFLAAIALVVAGVAASVSLAGNGPDGSGPPGQGECAHGNSQKPCKPDPQPEHGKDCEEHGKNGGVNEDHCTPTETTPDDVCKNIDGVQTEVPDGYYQDGKKCYPIPPTTPTNTTPTTPTQTTPTTPEQPRCPPGQGPYAGKDGQEGNDECCPDSDNNQQCDVTTTTVPTTAQVPPGSTLTTQSTTTSTATPATPATTPTTTTPPAPKVKSRTSSTVKHAKKAPPKLTGNPKVDKCKDLGNGTLNCKGVVVTQGNG